MASAAAGGSTSGSAEKGDRYHVAGEGVAACETGVSGEADIADIVAAYGRFYDRSKEHVATQSAIDLNRMGELRGGLDGFSAMLDQVLGESWTDLSRSLFYAETYSYRTDVRAGGGALSRCRATWLSPTASTAAGERCRFQSDGVTRVLQDDDGEIYRSPGFARWRLETPGEDC